MSDSTSGREEAGGYRVTITAVSELTMAAAAEAAYSSGTHRFVPGHIVLASLAGAWIRQHGIPDVGNPRRAEFESVFHSDVRYGPAMADSATMTPISAVRAKLSDKVADRAFGETLRDGDPGEQGKGQISDVAIVRLSRTQLETLSNTRERPADGQLFSREAIRRGTTLTGMIVGTHPWLDAIADLGTSTAIWLGGRKSTSGRAELTLTRGLAAVPDGPVDAEAVIRLAGPAIFVDDETRPSLEPGDHDWERIFGCPGAKVEQRWVRPGRLPGWHVASGLPRPEELITLQGSTYRVAVPAGADPAWPARLRRHGLGLRTGEGFGFAELCRQPWRPSAPAGEPTATATAAEELVEAHKAVLGDDKIRRWMVGVLHDVLLARRAGLPATGRSDEADADVDSFVEDLQKRATAQRLNQRQRDALAQFARVGETRTLEEIVVLLDDSSAEALA